MKKILETLVESPEVANVVIGEMISKYKPLFYSMLNEGFKMYKDLNGNDEYFIQRARSNKKMLDAYCNEGFSREEALMFIFDDDTLRKNILKSLISSSSKTNAAS